MSSSIRISWFRKHGFEQNPLSVKPKGGLIGVDYSKLKKSLNQKSIWAIIGDYGCGKTTLLKQLIRENNNRVIYLSHNRVDGSMNVKKFLINKGNFLKRLFNILPKNILFLIDESHNLNQNELDSLMEYYEKGVIQNLVFVNPNINLIGKVCNNALNLSKIDVENAVELVKERLNPVDLIEINAIKEIHAIVNGNPRKILEYSDMAIKMAYEVGDGRATTKHIPFL